MPNEGTTEHRLSNEMANYGAIDVDAILFIGALELVMFSPCLVLDPVEITKEVVELSEYRYDTFAVSYRN